MISRAVPAALRNELREALLDMHQHRRGSHVLSTGRVHKYVGVRDCDYDPIRMMLATGAGIIM